MIEFQTSDWQGNYLYCCDLIMHFVILLILYLVLYFYCIFQSVYCKQHQGGKQLFLKVPYSPITPVGGELFCFTAACPSINNTVQVEFPLSQCLFKKNIRWVSELWPESCPHVEWKLQKQPGRPGKMLVVLLAPHNVASASSTTSVLCMDNQTRCWLLSCCF